MKEKEITKYLNELVERGIPSVDCLVMQNHQVLYRYFAGTSDENRSVRLDGKERYLMFSMTKVQTMTAIKILLEQGKISLEDEVAKYLPAYQNLTVLENGKSEKLQTPLRLRHLVSMQSGLDYNLSRPGIVRVLRERGQEAATRELVDSFAESPISFQPGTHFQYSLSHDVAAALIEVVTGMRFSDFLRKNLWEPLHMENTFFAKPLNEDLPGLSTQYISTENGIQKMEKSCNYQLSENYESGGAGLISCTGDYASLADTLACGGISADGTQILKKETVLSFQQNLLCEAGIHDLTVSMGRKGYGYGCGMQIFLHPEEVNSNAPAGIFGWDGAAGSCIQMEPVSKRSFVFLMHVRNLGIAYSEFHPTLRDLIFC